MFKPIFIVLATLAVSQVNADVWRLMVRGVTPYDLPGFFEKGTPAEMTVDIDTDAPLLREFSTYNQYAVSDFDASLGEVHQFTPTDTDAILDVTNDGVGGGDLFQVTIFPGEIIPGLMLHQFDIAFVGPNSMLDSKAIPETIPTGEDNIFFEMAFTILETGQPFHMFLDLNELSAVPLLSSTPIPIPRAATVVLFLGLAGTAIASHRRVSLRYSG